MSQYYLMAQLPSLDALGENAPLPITEERFDELCERFLGKRALRSLDELTLVPAREGENVSSPLVNSWNDGERMLRLALAKVRAERMKKQFELGDVIIPSHIMQAAKMAIEMPDPLSAERYLCEYRLTFLETIRPTDPFSDDSVFFYGLKLKLLARMRRFDTEKGRIVYRNIYDSIISTGEREVNE